MFLYSTPTERLEITHFRLWRQVKTSNFHQALNPDQHYTDTDALTTAPPLCFTSPSHSSQTLILSLLPVVFWLDFLCPSLSFSWLMSTTVYSWLGLLFSVQNQSSEFKPDWVTVTELSSVFLTLTDVWTNWPRQVSTARTGCCRLTINIYWALVNIWRV